MDDFGGFKAKAPMRLERGSIGWHNAEVWYTFLGRKQPREAKGGAL